MERATGTEVYGCGSSQTTDITLNIQTTTGGNFSISLNGQNTVDHLKKLVSKKLKVSKDRICLLHRERQLREGTLDDNGLLDGSRVILLPSVETGLLSQRPENSVMQALESLNDSQVNDFLSGKSPLNLTMRLGDHMMLIQLQLSTVHGGPGCRQIRTSTPAKNTPTTSAQTECEGDTPTTSAKETVEKGDDESPLDKSGKENSNKESRATILKEKDLDMIQKAFELYKTFAEEKFGKMSEEMEDKDDSADTNCTLSDLSSTSDNDQSPIKSLSNLVSSPIDSSTDSNDAALLNTVKNNIIHFLSQNKSSAMPSTSAMCDKPCPSTSLPPDSSLSDDSGDNFTDQSSFLAESTIDEYPMENLFNSAVDKGLFEDHDETMMDREISNLATTSHGTQSTPESTTTLPSFQSSEPLKSKRFQYLLHKTSKFKHPIGQNKQKAFMQSVVNKHNKRMQNRQENNLTQPSTSRTEPYITSSRKLILQPSSQADDATPSTSKQSFKLPEAPKKPEEVSPTLIVDTKALREASKNLAQKLKKLTNDVLTNKIDLRTAEETVRKLGSGAVIDSMRHHGKGIYSGTFSGTLNPALQDKYGRPKRDISTVIHILNDLLCATAPPTVALSTKESKHVCTKSSEETGKCSSCSEVHSQCSHDRGAPATDVCKKCDTAKTLALENSKTKCKLDQLRLVMQQKKQRREARKLKTMPYANTPPTTIPSEQNTLKEEIETVA